MRISPASSAAHQCSTILSFRHPHPYHPSPHNPQFYLHLDFLRLPTTHFLKKKRVPPVSMLCRYPFGNTRYGKPDYYCMSRQVPDGPVQ